MAKKIVRIEFERLTGSALQKRFAEKGWPSVLVEETETGWTIQVEIPDGTNEGIFDVLDDLLRLQNLGGGTCSGESLCLKERSFRQSVANGGSGHGHI
jgi:hypothetical protein